MATTSQSRVFRRPGKPGPYPGNRMGPKDHFTPPPAMSSSPANLPGVYSNPDMAYALVAIMGCVVDVQMQSGEAYQGVLKAVSPQLSVALALAHNKAHEATRENTEKLMQLEFADIVSVSVMPESNASLSSKDIFKTDAEISRSNGSSFSKELQPFAFEDDGNPNLALHAEGARGWSAEDMFEINKNKFNVTSSFDEDLSEYTTKLDRSNTKDYQEREERAKRLAQEIEHNAERHGIDDTGTEEELFSSVVRGEAAPPPTTTSSFSKVAQNKITYANMSSHGRHPPLSSEGSDVVPVNSSQISSRTSDDAPTDPRLGHRPPPDINHLSPPSQGGFSQSQTDGSSSQEYHMVDSTDTDSGNVKGGWTSQESAASLTEEGPERGGSQCGGQVDLVVAEEDEEEQTEEFEEGREKEAKDKEVKVEEQVVEIPVASAMADEVGGDQQESKEEAATPPKDGSTEEASADKEKKVRSFRLDPNAKSFSFNPGAKEFVPSSDALLSLTTTSPLAQSSSSPAVLDSSSYPPLTNTPPLGKRYPNKRGGGMTSGRGGGRVPNYTPQDQMTVDYTGGGGYMYAGGGGVTQVPVAAAAAAAATLIRTSLHQVLPTQQLLQYSASVPQFLPSYQSPATGAGFINAQQQAVLAQNQHMGQKFVGDMSPQHQVFAGNQQYSMHMAPHQMMQQQPPMAAAHGIIPAAGTQAQFSAASTPTGLVTTPPAATPPAMMLVQQPGQGPAAAAAAASGGMYAPMQMAGVPMPQVGMGGAAAAAAAATTGQNPVLMPQPPTRFDSAIHSTP